jgi:hypothetical protein
VPGRYLSLQIDHLSFRIDTYLFKLAAFDQREVRPEKQVIESNQKAAERPLRNWS